jgi:hypothetical protein
MPERWQQELRKLTNLEPPADLWDQAMRRSHRPHPRSWRQRPVARRWQPIVAALAVALVASTLGLIRAFGPAADQAGPVVVPGQRYADPTGWTIIVPKGMEAAHFHFPTSGGSRVTNFVPDLSGPGTGSPPMPWLRSFPANGVALQIWYDNELPAPPPMGESALPLSEGSFSRVRPYVGGREPAPMYRDFVANGVTYDAAVWIGPQASAQARRAIWSVLRSLSFTPLQAGTVLHQMFYVLGPATRYVKGSVTLIPASSLPKSLGTPESFYLIHTPRGYYAINQQFDNHAKPPITCSLAFDPNTSQFRCPGTNLRWDRLGQPLGSHSGSADWALGIRMATVAQDGHMLVSRYDNIPPGF